MVQLFNDVSDIGYMHLSYLVVTTRFQTSNFPGSDSRIAEGKAILR